MTLAHIQSGLRMQPLQLKFYASSGTKAFVPLSRGEYEGQYKHVYGSVSVKVIHQT